MTEIAAVGLLIMLALTGAAIKIFLQGGYTRVDDDEDC